MTAPAHVLVADWGKEVGKRVAYHVEVARRSIAPVNPPAGGWTVNGLVGLASQLDGPVLVLIDVAIGLPAALFRAMRDACAHTDTSNFLQFLRARLPGEWLGEVRRHEDWAVRRPYIHVPKGNGSLTDFRNKAALLGVCLARAIDLETGGRSPLLLSGIPGTVGSGSRDVIGSLGALDANTAAVWPFDGPLDGLLASGRVVIGEVYPHALYGHTLLDGPSDERCLVAVGKTSRQTRTAAVAQLEGLQWHRAAQVALHGELIQRARDNEDDFDAYLSALGILRLLTENVPLEDCALRTRTGDQGRPLLDGTAEGGMMGVLATQLELGQTAFAGPVTEEAPGGAAPGRAKPQAAQTRSGRAGPWVRVTSASLANAELHPNYRQISFSGLPSGGKDSPSWAEIECAGRPYTLTIGDTTACWRSHQISTAEDFDALYDLLSKAPGRCFPVELAEVRSPAGDDLADTDGL